MSARTMPGREAIARHGVLRANRTLLLRRIAQLGFFGLFASGAWFGVAIAEGTLASSMTLGVLPLTDPLVLLQSLAAGHVPEATAWIGAGIVFAAYMAIGGRTYCSWVCPINPVADLAAWVRTRLGIEKGWTVKRHLRLWLLGAVLVTAFATSSIAFELINPITGVYRAALYGGSAAFGAVLAIFLFDVFVAKNGWCGLICPVGAFYGLLNEKALLRISAVGRVRCDDCMECYAVCPEQHVIAPALKARAGEGPVILHRDCTACGRCADVCPERVFAFTHRFDTRLDAASAEPFPQPDRAHTPA